MDYPPDVVRTPPESAHTRMRKPDRPGEGAKHEKTDVTAITLLDKWRFIQKAIPNKRLTAGDLRCLFAIADCYNSRRLRLGTTRPLSQVSLIPGATYPTA
jgi:hypothetical protein